jgi:hypothetical protein
MNCSTNFTDELDQTDEDILYEVSDETLEAATGIYIGEQSMMTIGPTIMMGGAADLGSPLRGLLSAASAAPTALRLTCSPATRRGASLPTSRSCRSCCAGLRL